MALPLIPIALVGGGVAYVAIKQPPAGPPTALVNGANQVSGGGSAPLSQTLQQGGTRPVGRHVPAGLAGMIRPVISGSHQDPQPLPGPGYDANKPPWNVTGQKLDMIAKGLQKGYDKLSSEAKHAAASEISDQLGIDPPLTGDESWDDMETTVESAAGAAIGGAIGGPIGAKLGAIAAAYFGKDINQYLNEGLDELQSDMSDAFDTASQYVEDAISDAGDSISDAASDAYDDASNYVSGLI